MPQYLDGERQNQQLLIQIQYSTMELKTNSPAGLTLRPVELDGDGKIDYMVLTSALNIYSIRGVFPSPIPDFNSPNSVDIINFDGDKKSEILVIKGNNSTIYQYDSQSESFSTQYTSTSFPLSSDRIYPGDFNGDKKTDLLYWRSGSGWSLKYSSGTGFATASNIPSLVNTDPGAATTDNNYYIADFNGDGKDDIAESNKSSSPSVLKLFFSRGTSFATVESNSFPKSTINQEYFLIGDFNGDEKRGIFYYDNSSTTTKAYIRFFHKDELKHFVNFISNGYNENTGINYFRLNNGGTSYIKGTGATFPVKDYNGPFYAVTSTWSFTTSLDSTVNKYYYEKAKFHQLGKGFLGFMKFQSVYYKQLSYETKKFSYDPNYFYLRLDTGEFKDCVHRKGTVTKYTNQVYSYGNKLIRPYISQVKSLDEVYETWAITDLTYDSYGNTLNSATVYKNINLTTEIEKYLKNTYGSYGNWGIPNRVLTATDSTIYTYVSDPPYVRKSSFQYDTRSNPTVTINDPEKTKAVTKTNVFNDYGLITQETISAVNLTSRVTQYDYDTKYRFVTKTTNPLGDFSTATYSSKTGNVLSVTDINNKRTAYLYDSFGNLIQVTDPLGIITTRSVYMDYAPVNNPVDYYVSLHTPGKPDVTELYSGSGQKMNTMTMGIDGTILEEFTYNTRGQIYIKKGPHYTGDWTHAPSVTYSYDDYGRVYSTWENHGFTSFTYNGRLTTAYYPCLLYTSDAADEEDSVDLGGRRIIKKK